MKTEKSDFGHELDLQSIFFIIGIRNRRIRLAEFKKSKNFAQESGLYLVLNWNVHYAGCLK